MIPTLSRFSSVDSSFGSRLWRALAVPVLASAAVAQQILLVQAGGGTPYQTIAQAVQAANHGDIIRIGPGYYAPFTCAKAVRIEGGPGVVVDEQMMPPNTAAVSVTGLPADSLFSLQNITLKGNSSYLNPRLFLSGAGRVVLDNVRPSSGDAIRLDAYVAGGVLANECGFSFTFVSGSTLHAVNCTWTSFGFDIGPLMWISNSRVSIVDGSVSWLFQLGGSGFRLLNDSQLTLGVVNGLPLATWFPPGIQPNYHFDIDATSSVVQHSAVIPAVPSFANGQNNWVRNDDPISLRVAAAGPGGTGTVSALGTGPVEALVLFVGSPVDVYTIPGVVGLLFVSNASFLVNLGFVLTNGQPQSVSFTVPNVPALAGLPLVAQGITGTLRMTNAHGFTLR